MSPAQMPCPHCGAMFDVAAGTPSACPICRQPLNAPSPSESAPRTGINAASDATLSDTLADQPLKLPVTAKARKAKDGILVSKPYAPPGAIASGAAPPSGPTVLPQLAAPTAPPLRKPQQSNAGGKAILLGSVFGLLLLFLGGLAIAGWKLTEAREANPDELNDSKTPKVLVKADDQKKSIPKENYPGGEDNLAKVSADELEDLRLKLEEELKQTLKRKVSARPVNEAAWDPILSSDGSRRIAVGVDQRKINLAIDKGVAFLKRTQLPNGSWSSGHTVGYASVGGLTLLECGVSAKDPAVQQAAKFVRGHIANLTSTYELSLAVLFLDRLGDPSDEAHIQGMGLRLMAGQQESGGWHYHCPLLPAKEMYELFNFVRANEEPNFLHPIRDKLKTHSGIVVNPVREPIKFANPFSELNDLILVQGIAEIGAAKKPKDVTGAIMPLVFQEKPPPNKKPVPGKTSPMKGKRPGKLAPNLKNLLVVKNQGKKKRNRGNVNGGGGTDNSNTQFALLALWAARRHGVPTDQVHLAGYHRFTTSQNADGGWNYHYKGSGSTASMTGVGLLGLAMGHGTSPEVVRFNPKNPKDFLVKPALQDPDIQRGLLALARSIGQPSTDPKASNFPMQNLYFLWTVERVAMLYDLKTIGGKDWYGWGAQILVHNQNAQGAWPVSYYPGQSTPLNTCFALLFLRRSNLVQDLTNNLRLYSGVRDGE
ncbi:MAG: hypothetical protein HYX68_20060 [Planctomycetes bacterium]|nr:hypothetical protein [Planctomycetota bacterium]